MRESAAIHRFGKQRVSAVFELDYDIESFARRDAELIHLDGLHVLPIGLHHRHLEAGDAHVEICHRARVNEA